MIVEVEPNERLVIRVGERIWWFEPNEADEVWVYADSKGRKLYADLSVTRSLLLATVAPAEEANGVRLNVTADP